MDCWPMRISRPPTLMFGVASALNLRTVQDWIVARRLLTISGIAAINSWGGRRKNSGRVDPHKLEAYSVTVPQILSALGNANITSAVEKSASAAIHQHPRHRPNR